MRTFASLDSFVAAAGTELGTSDWMSIDQKRIEGFADATEDHQWIHVDAERAAAGPFGTTIAHGMLTISLFPVLMLTIYRVEGISMGLNYGFNKVRFPAPVPVGSEVRMRLSLGEVATFDGGAQAVLPGTIEIRGGTKPVCVLEAIVRYLR